MKASLVFSELIEIFEVIDALAFVGEPRPEKAGDYLRFRTQMDVKVCPICAPLNGLILPLPQVLIPVGPYYSNSPPIHPRCRCNLEIETWIIETVPLLLPNLDVIDVRTPREVA